jgi:hypothetical protein
MSRRAWRFPHLPTTGYPAVIVIHTLAGDQQMNEGRRCLRKAGFTPPSTTPQHKRGRRPAVLLQVTALVLSPKPTAFRLLAKYRRCGAGVTIGGLLFGGARPGNPDSLRRDVP